MALGNTPRRETNISVEASKSYALGLYFVMKDGSPVDLTGSVVRLVAAEPPQRGTAEVLSLTAVSDLPETGLTMFKFQASDLTLEPGSYAYDVTLVPAGGYSTPVLKGYIEVGSNTDLDDTNTFTSLNITSDITVTMDYDQVTIEIERVDGMYLVVTNLITDFTEDMQVEVDAAAASAQASLNSANMSAAYAASMQAWLDNAGFPFWKGTQAQYDALTPKDEILYLITDEVT